MAIRWLILDGSIDWVDLIFEKEEKEEWTNLMKLDLISVLMEGVPNTLFPPPMFLNPGVKVVPKSSSCFWSSSSYSPLIVYCKEFEMKKEELDELIWMNWIWSSNLSCIPISFSSHLTNQPNQHIKSENYFNIIKLVRFAHRWSLGGGDEILVLNSYFDPTIPLCYKEKNQFIETI